MKTRVAKRVRMEFVVTRTDGSVDDYGVVMDSNWGPLRRWLAKRRIEKINRKRGV